MTPDAAAIRAMVPSERLALLDELLKYTAGGQAELPSGVVELALSTEVPPDAVVTVQGLCVAPFKLRRLVILETVAERTDVRTATHFEQSFFGKSRPCSTERDEQLRFEVVPRGAWEVRAAFVGQRLQFPQGAIGGEAFGPSGDLAWRDTEVASQLYVTLQVSHSSRTTLPFRAVLLGEAE